MNINERLSEAMLFLSETDEEYAELRTKTERLELKAKTVRSMVFLHESGNNEERKAKADTHQSYLTALEEYLAAKQESEAMGNKRETQDRAIDVLRTIESSRRKA